MSDIEEKIRKPNKKTVKNLYETTSENTIDGKGFRERRTSDAIALCTSETNIHETVLKFFESRTAKALQMANLPRIYFEHPFDVSPLDLNSN